MTHRTHSCEDTQHTRHTHNHDTRHTTHDTRHTTHTQTHVARHTRHTTRMQREGEGGTFLGSMRAPEWRAMPRVHPSSCGHIGCSTLCPNFTSAHTHTPHTARRTHRTRRTHGRLWVYGRRDGARTRRMAPRGRRTRWRSAQKSRRCCTKHRSVSYLHQKKWK
jgi:hypothetical protein